MSKHLKSREGYTIGYGLGADYTPLDYMQRSNPKTIIMPKGFRDLLRDTCPLAWNELCNGGTVHGFRFRNILEQRFD